MIYDIVPLEVFVWSSRMSDMYFVCDIAKMSHIKKIQYLFCINRTTGTPWDHDLCYGNDHAHEQDHDEQ